jgi:hypothetical protein
LDFEVSIYVLDQSVRLCETVGLGLQYMAVDLLILGAGWLSNFLIPLCTERSITYAATTHSGHDSTINFSFDPDSNDVEPYRILPDAKTVLITFPIVKAGAATRLVKLYQSSGSVSDPEARGRARFIQLGTTGIWDVSSFNNLIIPFVI